MWTALLGATLLASCPARGEIIAAREMLRGSDGTAEACARVGNAVWVMAYGQGFCMRYYLSTAGGAGDVPVVFLNGDRPTFDTLHENVRGGKTRNQIRRNEAQARKAKDVDTEDLAEQADKISRRTGNTVIYLSRMGLEGSSGHHGLRRTMLELHVTNAALDAIKQRHGFRGFHIFGQSGGATLTGGLLALRRDIGCAIPGSGRLALIVEPKKVAAPAFERFDPVKMIPAILQNSTSARIIVLTDPRGQSRAAQEPKRVRRAFQEGGRPNRAILRRIDEQQESRSHRRTRHSS